MLCVYEGYVSQGHEGEAFILYFRSAFSSEPNPEFDVMVSDSATPSALSITGGYWLFDYSSDSEMHLTRMTHNSKIYLHKEQVYLIHLLIRTLYSNSIITLSFRADIRASQPSFGLKQY